MKTIGQIDAAMEILKHRIANEPPNVVESSDRVIFKLLREAMPAISSLLELHEDSECYCPENLAIKTTCPYCVAKGSLWITVKGDK